VLLKDLVGEVVVLCLMGLGQFDIYTSRCADEPFRRGENRYEVFPYVFLSAAWTPSTHTSSKAGFARLSPQIAVPRRLNWRRSCYRDMQTPHGNQAKIAKRIRYIKTI